MKKATEKQINSLKELQQKSVKTLEYFELRAVYTHFLQILKDVDSLSQFSIDFGMKLMRFDFNSDKSYISSELKELMKSAIAYYNDTLEYSLK